MRSHIGEDSKGWVSRNKKGMFRMSSKCGKASPSGRNAAHSVCNL